MAGHPWPRQPPFASDVSPLGSDPAPSDAWGSVALRPGQPGGGDDPEAPHDAESSAGALGDDTARAVLDATERRLGNPLAPSRVFSFHTCHVWLILAR